MPEADDLGVGVQMRTGDGYRGIESDLAIAVIVACEQKIDSHRGVGIRARLHALRARVAGPDRGGGQEYRRRRPRAGATSDPFYLPVPHVHRLSTIPAVH